MTRISKVVVSVLRVPVPLYECEVVYPPDAAPHVARVVDDFENPSLSFVVQYVGDHDVARRYRLELGDAHLVVVPDLATTPVKDPACKNVWAPVVVRSRKELAAAHMSIDDEFDFDAEMLIRVGPWPMVAIAEDVPRVHATRSRAGLLVPFPLPMRVVGGSGQCGEVHPCELDRPSHHRVLDVDWSALERPVAIPKSSRRVRLEVRKVDWVTAPAGDAGASPTGPG